MNFLQTRTYVSNHILFFVAVTLWNLIRKPFWTLPRGDKRNSKIKFSYSVWNCAFSDSVADPNWLSQMKMVPKALATNHRLLVWLCVCPPDESTNCGRRPLRFIFPFTVCTFICCTMLSSVAFIVKFISTDFEACLYGLFQIAANTAIWNVIIVAVIHRQRIGAIVTKLSDIYVASKMQMNWTGMFEFAINFAN